MIKCPIVYIVASSLQVKKSDGDLDKLDRKVIEWFKKPSVGRGSKAGASVVLKY